MILASLRSGAPARGATILLLFASAGIGAPKPAAAQLFAPPSPFHVFAGSELEDYLRTLQNVGRVGPYPWSVRGFSPNEVYALQPPALRHPWAARTRLSGGAPGGAELGLIAPTLRSTYNSAFPYGGNDGPVWAGRGLTTSVTLGAFARVGPLTVVLAPMAFRAENDDFELAANGQGGMGAFRSPLTPSGIDLPQRFGTEAYQRVDAGNSTIRLEGLGIAAGASTAAQQWGPSVRHPLILGPNAGGFPHLFLGTARPLNLGIGHLHGRFAAGRLDETEYSPSPVDDPRRAMSGVVLAFNPRGLSGLELGLVRFFHEDWPEDGFASAPFLRPFETIWKERIADADETRDSQFASVFARWNFPGAGFEFFGEYVRVDHSYTRRVFVLEPDDQAGYSLGFRRVWEGGPEQLTVLRGEALTTGSSHRERGGARAESAFRARPIYHHHQMRQGLTHRGQLLATPAGHFGTGSILALDRYHPGGRWSVEWERMVQRDRTLGVSPEDSADAHVRYVLSGSALLFLGPVDVEAGVRAVYDLNRYLRQGDDRFNLNLVLAATLRP